MSKFSVAIAMALFLLVGNIAIVSAAEEITCTVTDNGLVECGGIVLAPVDNGTSDQGTDTVPTSTNVVHFDPEFFDGNNCPPEMTNGCTEDVSPNGQSVSDEGYPATQVSIIWGVGVEWNGQVAPARMASNGEYRCSIVAVPPNNFLNDVTIVDGRWETYDVDPTRVNRTSDQDAGWLLVLAKQRADEQADHFGCPYLGYEDITIWTSGMASPPESVEGFDNYVEPITDTTEDIVETPVEEVVPEDNASQDNCAAFETIDCMERNASVDNKEGKAKFQKGDAVIGTIFLGNSKDPIGPCYFRKAPQDGYVKGGMVHPWVTEWNQQTPNMSRCNG